MLTLWLLHGADPVRKPPAGQARTIHPSPDFFFVNESFWTGVPGILTALAGLVAAVGTLIGVLHKTGVLGRADAPDAESAIESPATGQESDIPVTLETQAPAPPTVILRSAPAILPPEELSTMLLTRGFFDQRLNLGGSPASQSYEVRVDGDMLMIEDSATGLTWEMGGSEQPMTFDEAPGYVDRLSDARAGGFADWRIPTAEEVMSLMTPETPDSFHLGVEFRRRVGFIWTADEVDEARGWVVYFADGIIAVESKQFNAWVRAVR